MRRLALVVLSLAVLSGCNPPPPAAKPKSAPSSSGSSSGATTSSMPNDASVRLVTLSVPKMTCPHACWPEVKKVLENQTGVARVELPAQPNADEITDRRVFIALKGDFNAEKAISELATIGFDESKLVSQ